MTRELESEVSELCDLSKGVEKKGIQKGVLTSIQNLTESTGWSVEQAMKALKIPETEQHLYLDNLEEWSMKESAR